MEFGLGLDVWEGDNTFELCAKQAVLAEKLGFDVVWTQEHHSNNARLYSSPLTVLAFLAPQTERIRLGSNVVVLPLHHPLHIAEVAAAVDVMSGGRLILGVSAGYVREEFEAFGVALSDRAKLMNDGIQCIRRAWTNASSERASSGDATYGFFPPPLQKLGPGIYVGGLARAAIRRAAILGDGLILSAGSPLRDLPERIRQYKDALTEVAGANKESRLPIAINRIVQVVASRSEKLQAEQQYTAALLGIYDNLGHDDIGRLADSDRAISSFSQEHFIIGEASECIERIEEYRQIGIGHICCLMKSGSGDAVLVDKSVTRFGDLVIPHFR